MLIISRSEEVKVRLRNQKTPTVRSTSKQKLTHKHHVIEDIFGRKSAVVGGGASFALFDQRMAWLRLVQGCPKTYNHWFHLANRELEKLS